MWIANERDENGFQLARKQDARLNHIIATLDIACGSHQ